LKIIFMYKKQAWLDKDIHGSKDKKMDI